MLNATATIADICARLAAGDHDAARNIARAVLIRGRVALFELRNDFAVTRAELGAGCVARLHAARHSPTSSVPSAPE